MIQSFLFASAGALLLGSTGAFFLYVPLLSIMTVASIMLGIILVMNARGADKLLDSKFTLGAEGSVAAGPVGRTATAQTDAQMHADILSWSRSQGLFAGLALEGATLRQDLDDNQNLYGRKIGTREIVTSG